MEEPEAEPLLLKILNVTTVCECIVCKLLENGFCTYSSNEKEQIISKGRPTPKLPNLVKQSKLQMRRFQTEIYKQCKWLTGCDSKSLLFCWPCVLFSGESNLWNKYGVSNLQNLHKSIRRHSSSKGHIQSIFEEKLFGKFRKEQSWDEQLHAHHVQHNQQVRRNRDILRRFIDALVFLGEHELAFNCNDESQSSFTGGSYIDLLNLLSRYDETLRLHLENCTVFEGTSSIIQNDIISSIAEVTLRKVRSEIDESPFLAIILDQTTDVTNCNQLSKIVRYVTKDGVIKEHFLGFVDITTQRTAMALHAVVQTAVEEVKCSSKLVAQSYNGAAVIAGELESLQNKVRDTYPCALFIHCMTYPLNLVLQHSLSSIRECNIFFSTLNGIASFFSKSSKRANALNVEISKRLPKVTAIKWNYSGELVHTVSLYRQLLIDFFEKILENQLDWDLETVFCSRGYLDILKTGTNFNLLLLLFSEIFPFSDKVFAALQNRLSNINFCSKKIQEFKSIVLSKREQFDLLWEIFEQIIYIKDEQQRKKICTDVIEDKKSCYKSLILEIIDNISTCIDDNLLKNVENLKFFELMNFSNHTSVPKSPFESLKQSYPEHFDFSALRTELSVIYDTSEGLNKNSVSDLWSSLKTYGLDQTCPEVIKLCQLVLTIPFLNASTKCVSSASSRIQNFVLKSSGQRVSPLSILAIEKTLIQELRREATFYDDVIDEFAKVDRIFPLKFI